jgi:hypothetical protein
MSGWANLSSYTANTNAHIWNTNANSSFIFVENGIEFSVFKDGQFDFYLQNHGPQLNVGGRIPNFSFNTGFNYNPYVQYDSFGAIVQIENTPVFYDQYGRVQQVGNIFIDYNRRGFVNRIGGLQVYYRGNNIWRQTGFINLSHRNFVWRPWHRYYALPAVEFCLISNQPYRQFYRPVRHIYYRPYRNNNRHFAFNRHSRNYRNNANTSISQRYAQSPRNRAERNLRSNVQRRYVEVNHTRRSNLARTVERRASNVSERTSRSFSERGNRTQVNRSNSRVESQPDRIQNRRNRNEVAVKKPRTSSSNKSLTSRTTSRENVSVRSTRISKPRASQVKKTARPAARRSTEEVKSTSNRRTMSRADRKPSSGTVKTSRNSRSRS